MPELPEVETVRRGLSRQLDFNNTQIVRVEKSDKKLRYSPDSKLLKEIQGQRILSVDRKAKYLLFFLEDFVLLSHLGMTGSWRFEKVKEKHDHIRIHLSDGRTMTYQDARRFGMFEIFKKETLASVSRLTSLGIDPVSDSQFSGDYLYETLRNSQVAVKVAIMNQRVVVGVGNIYASEALYLAGIHPKSPCSAISLGQWRLLAKAIRKILYEAIELGGSSIQNYTNTEGEKGSFQNLHFVYGKKGEPCRVCQSKIESQAIVGRNSFWCPQCQVL